MTAFNIIQTLLNSIQIVCTCHCRLVSQLIEHGFACFRNETKRIDRLAILAANVDHQFIHRNESSEEKENGQSNKIFLFSFSFSLSSSSSSSSPQLARIQHIHFTIINFSLSLSPSPFFTLGVCALSSLVNHFRSMPLPE
jgi:hypothetical protein